MFTLKDWYRIAKKTRAVYYVAESLSRTGMGGSYTLYVVHRGQLMKAWPNGETGYDEKLAKRLGFRMTKSWRAWYRGGCGYDRVHAVLYAMAREFGENLDAINPIRIESLHSGG
jgi:hypothetical protein